MNEPDNTDARAYVRFAALGDSATYGIGDPVDGGWRGWARILADAIAAQHDLSFCNLSVPGATADRVCLDQLDRALEHTPQIASLIVGLNDTMRSTWDPEQVHTDLLQCADELSHRGALLLTARFHDHSRVFRLPRTLARPMARRIEALNAAYDEIHSTYGSLQVDLAAEPQIYDRAFWSIDRLHPSELGHRVLASRFAALLNEQGLPFDLPSLSCTGTPTKMSHAKWLATEVAPWVGRRARDLAPTAARFALGEARTRLTARRPVLRLPAGETPAPRSA